jgi:hypothetical protein
MDSILNKKISDRIYRIDWIFFKLSGIKPENPIAFGEKRGFSSADFFYC